MATDSIEQSEILTRFLDDPWFTRIAGAAPIGGNAVRILRDAAENYPAWLAAIRAARQCVLLENYIFADDAVGRRFAAALMDKAREGVTVRLLYDWLGTWRNASARLWRELRAAGVEVRCFNPPRLDSPFGWISRNHRKTLSIDGQLGFVAGLCIACRWEGNPERGVPPWRDTGLELRGPAVAELQRAFRQSWDEARNPATTRDPPAIGLPPIASAGNVSVRVIASRPNMLGLYRVDQLIAAMARRSLWLTDAYFVGTTAYVRTLCDAARDGVDVRLLVPGTSDIGLAKALARASYRPLLEAGIRVFEWNGPMLHAKTAVADGSWARIGSSNLNLASWLGNWELDLAIQDATAAGEMEQMFLQDLENATEIVLDLDRVHTAGPREGERRRGSPGRIAAGAVGLGSAVGAAITNRRPLGPAEARVMFGAGLLLLAVGTIAALLPRLITIPLTVLCLWIAIALLARATKLRQALPIRNNKSATI